MQKYESTTTCTYNIGFSRLPKLTSNGIKSIASWWPVDFVAAVDHMITKFQGLKITLAETLWHRNIIGYNSNKSMPLKNNSYASIEVLHCSKVYKGKSK